MSEARERAAKLLADLKNVGEFDVHGPFLREIAEVLLLLATQLALEEKFEVLVERAEEVARALGAIDRRVEAETLVDNIEELPPEPKIEPNIKRRPWA